MRRKRPSPWLTADGRQVQAFRRAPDMTLGQHRLEQHQQIEVGAR